MVHDPQVALETLISLGFERVLTSGCDSSALEGLSLIKKLAEQVSVPSAPLGHLCSSGFFLGIAWRQLLCGNPHFCEGAAVQELFPPTSGLALVCFPKSLWVGSLKSPAARADWAVLAHEKEGGKSRFQDRALAAI